MLVYETKTDPRSEANDTLNIKLYYDGKKRPEEFANDVVIGPDITGTITSEGYYPTQIFVNGIDIGQGGGGSEPTAYIKDASVSDNTLTLTKKDSSQVTFKNTTYTAGSNITIDADNKINAITASAEYIELSGWNESTGWHDGGTLSTAQVNTLLASELNYIWMNGMHRLDFRYRHDANNLATYSANDGTKTHVIQIKLSDKTWQYAHNKLQLEYPEPPSTAGTYTLKATVNSSGNVTYSWQ